MVAQTVKVTELQVQLGAKSAELLQLSAKHGKLNNESSHVNLQRAADATVPDSLILVTGADERPAKRLKMTQLSKSSSITPSIKAFLALLTERNDFKNHCETVALESMCISELAAEAK